MLNALYLILTLIVAIYAIISGFRRGITRQLTSLLGMAFGAVGARLLTPEFIHYFEWARGLSQEPDFILLTQNLVGSVIIYALIYWFFSLFNIILKRIFAYIEIGMFNRLIGAFFSLINNLLWLSIFFNLILCFSPSSRLLNYEKANDGNLISAVMAMTPVFLGCYGAEDFAHFNQLKEAKRISCNFRTQPNVITTQG